MQSPPCQTETSTAAAYLSLNPRKSCALPAGVFSQVYRAFYGNALKHKWLKELRWFTCGGGRRTHRGEKAFSGTFAAARLTQVYRKICGKALVLCELQKTLRFTCGGVLRTGWPEKHVWGTFAAEALPQVYRKICGKAFVLCEFREILRFTCGDWWWVYCSEGAGGGYTAARGRLEDGPR